MARIWVPMPWLAVAFAALILTPPASAPLDRPDLDPLVRVLDALAPLPQDAVDAPRGLGRPLERAAVAAGFLLPMLVPPRETAPLPLAFAGLYEALGARLPADQREGWEASLAALDPKFQEGLAVLLDALAAAQGEASSAAAGLDPAAIARLRACDLDAAACTRDAVASGPARAFVGALAAGGVRVLEAVDRAAPLLRAAAAWDGVLEDPLGLVRVAGGASDALPAADRGLLLDLDLGGDDLRLGPSGSATGLLAAVAGPCAASGAGTDARVTCAAAPFVSLSLDLGGNDAYSAVFAACGSGRLGLGLLVDLGGSDSYNCGSESEGFGSTGVGVLLDAAGDDVYACTFDCQAHGRVGGIGVLLDAGGNDRYDAGSWTQGASVNMGGLGLLADAGGTDQHASGTISQGVTDRLSALGVLLDGAGDDIYDFTSTPGGRGAVFGAFPFGEGGAVFLDLAGADTYRDAPGANGARWMQGVAGLGIDCDGSDCG